MISFSTETKDIRRFGFVALVFFGILCGAGAFYHRTVPLVLFGILALMGFAFMVAPAPMRPLYVAWMKVSHFIGRVVTLLMLTVAFYLVITPAAIIKRLCGGRPLPLRPDRSAASYWVSRDEPVQPPERFLKRY